MKPFTALLGAAAGTHAADQMALATLPLTATLVLGAGPDLLGLLVEQLRQCRVGLAHRQGQAGGVELQAGGRGVVHGQFGWTDESIRWR